MCTVAVVESSEVVVAVQVSGVSLELQVAVSELKLPEAE